MSNLRPQQIGDVQNQTASIDLLKVAAVMNRRAEASETARWALAVLAAAFGLVAVFQLDGFLSALAAILGVVVATLDEFMWRPITRRSRSVAVLAQEAFDVRVLCLPWNESKGRRLSVAVVTEFAKKFRGDDSRLRDWYSDVSNIPFPVAELLCQRENVGWSIGLRSSVTRWSVLALSVWLLAGLALGCFMNWLVFEYLYRFVAPTLPIVIVVVTTLGANLSSVRTKRYLADRIDARLADLTPSTAANWSAVGAERDLRVNQDEIFDSRMKSPRVLEWLYRSRRDEDAENYAAEAASRRAYWSTT